MIGNFRIEPNINVMGKTTDCGFLINNTIAPNQSIKLLVLVTDVHKFSEEDFCVYISYYPISGLERYEEAYPLNNAHALKCGYAIPAQTTDQNGLTELKDIAHSLEIIKMNSF